MRAILVSLAAAMLAGCAMTVPVAVITRDGRNVMHGTATAAVSGGTFQVSGPLHGRTTSCSGTYDAWDQSETITIPVTCDDGRKGTVVAHRDVAHPMEPDGSGTVTLKDGTTALFVFGKSAASY